MERHNDFNSLNDWEAEPQPATGFSACAGAVAALCLTLGIYGGLWLYTRRNRVIGLGLAVGLGLCLSMSSCTTARTSTQRHNPKPHSLGLSQVEAAHPQSR